MENIKIVKKLLNGDLEQYGPETKADVVTVEKGAGKYEGNATNAQAAFVELYNNKVDKVNGEGLSDNNYTDADKAAVGTIGDKVDKVNGKGLSTNDFTDALKTKLDNIADNATKTTANPTLAGTEANLTGLQVGNTKYKVPSGSGGGMSNPMTDEGDLIIGGSSGNPERLGVGTSGQVLTSNGSTASWQTPSSGSSDCYLYSNDCDNLNIGYETLSRVKTTITGISINLDLPEDLLKFRLPDNDSNSIVIKIRLKKPVITGYVTVSNTEIPVYTSNLLTIALPGLLVEDYEGLEAMYAWAPVTWFDKYTFSGEAYGTQYSYYYDSTNQIFTVEGYFPIELDSGTTVEIYDSFELVIDPVVEILYKDLDTGYMNVYRYTEDFSGSNISIDSFETNGSEYRPYENE